MNEKALLIAEQISILFSIGTPVQKDLSEAIAQALEEYTTLVAEEALRKVCYQCFYQAQKVGNYEGHICAHLQKAIEVGASQMRERAAKAMEFQIGKSLETSFDRSLVEGGITVIRSLPLVPEGDTK